ncbi:MAG: MFS transporter [Lacunisphaera sp.]|nr:MFS transporter [Lacunisphaera sp.]
MPSRKTPIRARAWLILLLTGVAGMLFYVDRQTLSVLKSTLKAAEGWTDTQYSWLVTAFMVPYTLCYIVTGYLIDRWGTRLMMPLFLGAMSLATLISGMADNLVVFGASRFLLGAAEAGIVPAVLVAIVTWFPYNRRGMANTFNKPLTVAGQVLVAPLAAWITLQLGWRWAFVLPGLIGLAAALLWFGLDRAPPFPDEDYTTRAPVSFREVFHLPVIRGVLLARLVSDPLWFFLIFWQPGFLQEELGMSLEKFGRIGWIPAAASVGFIMLTGVMSDWLIVRGWTPVASRLRILTLTAALSPALLALLWVHGHGPALALLTVVQIMTATWLSMTGLLMSDLVPRRMVGTSVSVISAVGAAAGGLVNLAAGPLIEAVGYSTLLVLGCLLHPLAAVILWWHYGRKPAASRVLPARPATGLPSGR